MRENCSAALKDGGYTLIRCELYRRLKDGDYTDENCPAALKDGGYTQSGENYTAALKDGGYTGKYAKYCDKVEPGCRQGSAKP